jgi:hypothetical protein
LYAGSFDGGVYSINTSTQQPAQVSQRAPDSSMLFWWRHVLACSCVLPPDSGFWIAPYHSNNGKFIVVPEMDFAQNDDQIVRMG